MEVYMNFHLIFSWAYDHLEQELASSDGIIAFDPALFAPLDVILPCEIYVNLVLVLYEIKQSKNLTELLQCTEMNCAELVDMMFLDTEAIENWATNPTSFEKGKKHIAYHIFLTRVLTHLAAKRVETLGNN